MYRLWLWPLGLSPIFIFAWVAVKYDLAQGPILGALGLIWFPIVHAIDRKYAVKHDPEIEKNLPDPNYPSSVKINSTSQKVIGWFAFVIAIFLIAFGTNDYGNKLPSILTASVFMLIAGACLLPQKIKGYFGDVIAILVIASAIWFFFTPYKEADARPFMFAFIFGGGAAFYLFKRYKHHLKKPSHE